MFTVLLCSSVFQAPKKAKRRQQQGEGGGSSNVFSMFEQSQIQEYKEVSFFCSLAPRGLELKGLGLEVTGSSLKSGSYLKLAEHTKSKSKCFIYQMFDII